MFKVGKLRERIDRYNKECSDKLEELNNIAKRPVDTQKAKDLADQISIIKIREEYIEKTINNLNEELKDLLADRKMLEIQQLKEFADVNSETEEYLRALSEYNEFSKQTDKLIRVNKAYCSYIDCREKGEERWNIAETVLTNSGYKVEVKDESVYAKASGKFIERHSVYINDQYFGDYRFIKQKTASELKFAFNRSLSKDSNFVDSETIEKIEDAFFDKAMEFEGIKFDENCSLKQ